ncbi:MAG: T9SS type A sorting domain-containing protein [Saprospiraceae bacterium]
MENSDPNIYCVTVTDATGCVSTACTDSFPPYPCSVDIDINGGTLTANPSGTPIDIHWNTGENTLSIQPQLPGLYCVDIIDSTGCAATNCIWFDPDSSACAAYIILDSLDANGTTYLSAGGTGNAPYTFTWSNGDTNQSTSYPPNTNLFCVTVTDADGCEAIACDSTFFNFCEVYVVPNANGGLSAQPTGFAPFNYEWSTGENTQSIMVNNFGLYCVTVTDASGCTSSSCFDFQPPFIDSCEVVIWDVYLGGNEHLLEALPFGEAPFTYNWSIGETTSSVQVTSPGTYCVTVTDATGCAASSCVSIQSPTNTTIRGFVYTIDSTFNLPFINGYAVLYQFDINGNVEPVDTTQLGNLLNTPSYDFGDRDPGDYLVQVVPDDANLIPTYHFASSLWDQADVISIPYAGPGNFDVAIFNFQPRPGPGSISGLVNKVPGFNGGVGPRSNNPEEGVHVLLFDLLTDELLDFRTSDADGNFSFPDLAYGQYRVMVDIPGHNRAWVDVMLSPTRPNADNLLVEITEGGVDFTTTSLDDLVEEQSLILYPNPVKESLNLRWKANASDEIFVTITDVNGRLIKKTQFTLTSGENNLNLNVQNLQDGLYFLNLTDGQTTLSNRFIKN